MSIYIVLYKICIILIHILIALSIILEKIKAQNFLRTLFKNFLLGKTPFKGKLVVSRSFW